MTLAISAVVRLFQYNGVPLMDPGPSFSPEAVRDLYTAQYPELTTAAVDGPELAGAIARYRFARAAGAKGSDA